MEWRDLFLGYRSCRSTNLRQCVPFLSLPSVFIRRNGYYMPESISILWKLINVVTKLEGKTPIQIFLSHD